MRFEHILRNSYANRETEQGEKSVTGALDPYAPVVGGRVGQGHGRGRGRHGGVVGGGVRKKKKITRVMILVMKHCFSAWACCGTES